MRVPLTSSRGREYHIKRLRYGVFWGIDGVFWGIEGTQGARRTEGGERGGRRVFARHWYVAGREDVRRAHIHSEMYVSQYKKDTIRVATL